MGDTLTFGRRRRQTGARGALRQPWTASLTARRVRFYFVSAGAGGADLDMAIGPAPPGWASNCARPLPRPRLAALLQYSPIRGLS